MFLVQTGKTNKVQIRNGGKTGTEGTETGTTGTANEISNMFCSQLGE